MKYSSTFITLIALLTLTTTSAIDAAVTFDHSQRDDGTLLVTAHYTLDKDDALFKDSVRFSVADPTITVDSWNTDTPATKLYDRDFKTDKLSYTDSGTFKITLTLLRSSKSYEGQAQLYMHYRLKNEQKPQEQVYELSFANPQVENSTTLNTDNPYNQDSQTSSFINKINILFSSLGAQLGLLKTFVSNLVQNSQSTSIRLLFVFLLGILMSLTPCIYPMIPVTLGILQTTAGTSLARNFSLALSYSLGIATTFATLGLLAASGSAHFGALLGNPYFVVFLVSFLGYLAFSMLGFYDMYTPRFLQGGDQGSVNGSFASAFVFGVISGSVASPCLSPGLLLLLSIVATLGSKLLGFIYLFIFGLGLSMPLLIIGTFSNSMNVLPRAGLWMIEVKKLFGFMLLTMCFYYLSNVMSWYLWLWLVGFSVAASGMLYLTTIESYYSTGMKWFKQITGSTLLLVGCLVFFQAYKATVAQEPHLDITHWNMDYSKARNQALEKNKLMLVDFGAAWCSSCNEIEHKILHNKLVQEQLDHSTVMVKVDCTNPHAEHCAWIQEKYNIIGFPTILLVTPQEETIIARWGGELLDLSPEQFIELVQQQTD